MSLLDDLRGLDVSGIVDARGSLSAAVDTTDLQALAAQGNSVAVLGDLGRSLQSLRDGFPSPEAALQPLIAALVDLAPHLESKHLPIAALVDGVREGATLVGRVLAGFNDHPAEWGKSVGRSIGDALQLVGGTAGDLASRIGRTAERYPDLLNLVDEPPADPAQLAAVVLEVLLPFPRDVLVALRDGTGSVTEGAGRIALPAGRTAGLVAAFDVVAAAAATRDPLRIEAALRELDRARRHTLNVLQDDLRFVEEQVARLRIGPVLTPLADASRGLRRGREGVIEFMGDLTRMLADIRSQIENVDVAQVRRFLHDLPDLIEKSARERIEAPIDALVARAKNELRDFLGRLGVRHYRAEVSQFLHEIAQRIDDADLDAPARVAHRALAEVSSVVTSNSLADQIGAEMQRLNAEMGAVLDRIEAPLTRIAGEVDALADRAVAILTRTAEALSAFQAAIEELQRAVDGLGVQQTGQQVVQSLQNLREKADDLLRRVPLPESLRPQVEQLVEVLRSIDLDATFEPVRAVAAGIRVPEELADVVHGGLLEARRVIDNLIPQQLIESIAADVGRALESIRAFNPASLLPDVSGYLEEAASAVERLDPRQAAEAIRGPYQQLLDLLDRAHPLKLLEPAINVYDSLLGAIPAPNPLTVAERLTESFDGVGRVAGRALLEPVARLTHEAGSQVGDPSSRRPIEVPDESEEIRPGDAIRLLGYVPGKLREALQALEAGVAGDVLREVDSCCAGLARQLRSVSDAIANVERKVDGGLEALLAPVATAQARAQLALHANLSSEQVTLHLDALAAAGPASLRLSLAGSIGSTRRTLRGATTLALGPMRQSFDDAAAALESSPLAAVAGNLDALLAVLDPEPIAAEMDRIVAAAIQRTDALLEEIGAEFRASLLRVRAIINELNPLALAQRFLAVLDVLKEELDVLDPRRLAAELGEIHAVLRATIEAYDPRIIAQDLFQISRDVARQIRALNPTLLLGSLDFWKATVDRVAVLDPAARLGEVGAALRPIGERLASVDLDALVDSVNRLGPVLLDEFEIMLDGIRNEIVALLESLRFATGAASASVSVGAGA